MTPSLEADETQRAEALLALRSGNGVAERFVLPRGNGNGKGSSTHNNYDSDDGGGCLGATNRTHESTVSSHRHYYHNNNNNNREIFVRPRSPSLHNSSMPPLVHRNNHHHKNKNDDGTAMDAIAEEPTGYSHDYNNNNSSLRTFRGSPQLEDFAATEDEARCHIERLCAINNWDDKEREFDVLLALLERFPSLCVECFQGPDGTSHFPIVTLFYASASVHTVMEIFRLAPHVLTLPGQEAKLPLHLACEMDFIDDVTIAVAKLYPVALTLFDSDRMLPIQRAMARHVVNGTDKASFYLIRSLVNLYPQSAAFCLDDCIHGGFDIFVLRFILSRLPFPLPQLSCGPGYYGKPVLINLDKARVLEKILAHGVQFVQIEPNGFSTDGWLFLMHCFQKDPQLTRSLKLKFSSSALNSECVFALKEALSVNTHITQLYLTCTDHNASKDNSVFLGSVKDGLSDSTSIQAVQLKQFRASSQVLRDLIMVERTIELVGVVFMDVPVWTPQNDKTLARIGSLSLMSCTISADCLRKLLRELVHVPLLHSLMLDVVGPPTKHDSAMDQNEEVSITTEKQFDMTAPLIDIVRKRGLKKLILPGLYPTLDVPTLCEELKQNDTLNYLEAPFSFATNNPFNQSMILDVLAHNTALYQVKTCVDKDNEQNEQINHFTRLNICGRTKARCVSTSRNSYIELICSVAMMNFEHAGMLKHSLIYGLLRESPNQWSLEADGNVCVSPTSRKRRRDSLNV